MFFFPFFLVLSLFYRSPMVNFKEKYHFSRFRRGPIFSSGGGGGQLFPGGSKCLFPIETHITCDFPGGSGPPFPPLDPHLAAIYLVSQSAKWCDRLLHLCLFSCNFVVCFQSRPTIIRCNFPDISYLSETQKNNFQFLKETWYKRNLCIICHFICT